MINLKVKGEHFEVEPDELKMLEAFSEMFPDCQQAVSLVVNKIEYGGANNLKALILQEWSKTINNR